tara:strand:+ start:20773 stop:22068 length:1296 start_codon:yes stop_codon:yes gene_type:complete
MLQLEKYHKLTFSNFKSVLYYLYKLQRNEKKYSLDNTYKLLKPLGNPQNQLRCIHIAGTNGKGSVSASINRILMEMGIKVGLYTSPHLLKFNERIKVDGISITDEEIEAFVKINKTHFSKVGCSFFEATTAMALNYFVSKNVEVGVIETGLGGRLDSTNVIKPDLTVITPISLDHRQVLGNSLVEIALEKSGIMKPKIPLVISDQEEEVCEVFSKKAKLLKCPFKIIKDSMVENIQVGYRGTNFSYFQKQYETNLIGVHQARNSVLAIEATKMFEPKIMENTIKNGLKKVVWPGRLELLEDFIFFDVAHNKSSIMNVLNTIKILFPSKDLVALLCLKADKEPSLFAKYFKQHVKKLYITTDYSKTLMDPITLSGVMRNNGCANEVLKDIKEGIIKLKLDVKKGAIGIILGSHFIAEEVYNEFQISFDPDQI